MHFTHPHHPPQEIPSLFLKRPQEQFHGAILVQKIAFRVYAPSSFSRQRYIFPFLPLYLWHSHIIAVVRTKKTMPSSTWSSLWSKSRSNGTLWCLSKRIRFIIHAAKSSTFWICGV